MTGNRSWAVVQFPGSNCDHDLLKVFKSLPGIAAQYHWHEDPIEVGQYEVIGIPGGFSFGDYLRAGAIAKLSNALKGLEKAVEAGAHVLGICNGFQILVESRLLPGYLHVNQSLRFISKNAALEVKAEAYPWIQKEDIGKVWHFPIAHRFGNYQKSKIDALDASSPLYYFGENPNGSAEGIAAVYRQLGKGSLFALMPHPERAFFGETRNADGQKFFENAVKAVARA